jgi:hypothetical protein
MDFYRFRHEESFFLLWYNKNSYLLDMPFLQAISSSKCAVRFGIIP